MSHLREQWLSMTQEQRMAFVLDAIHRKDRDLMRDLLDEFHELLSLSDVHPTLPNEGYDHG